MSGSPGAAAAAPQDRWIATGRGRLLARRWAGSNDAAAAPLVLLHDSLGCVALWRDFPALLARQTGRSVIAYDRLGFGQSDRRTDRLAPDFIEEEAREFFPLLREQLGLERFALFGHSVGGGMAVHCAALHADGCEALITESAQAFVEDRTRDGILQAQAAFQDPQERERLRRYHADKAEWVLDAWIGTWLSPQFASWSLNDVLPRVCCRTLVLHGSDDEYGSRAHPEAIAARVAGPARLEVLADTRHVPHREHPTQVAQRVADFLAAAADVDQ